MRGTSAWENATVAPPETTKKRGGHVMRMYFYVSLALLVLLTAYGLLSGHLL